MRGSTKPGGYTRSIARIGYQINIDIKVVQGNGVGGQLGGIIAVRTGLLRKGKHAVIQAHLKGSGWD